MFMPQACQIIAKGQVRKVVKISQRDGHGFRGGGTAGKGPRYFLCICLGKVLRVGVNLSGQAVDRLGLRFGPEGENVPNAHGAQTGEQEKRHR
jgi:hypothetical protein